MVLGDLLWLLWGELWYEMAQQCRQCVVTGCSSTAVSVSLPAAVLYCRRRAGHMVLRVLYFYQQCLYGSEATSCRQNAAECGRRIELSCDTTCR